MLNFHGSDDSYYKEWFEEMEDGWITAINSRNFILEEMNNYNIDSYFNSGGELDILNWRTMKPQVLFEKTNQVISKRIDLI